MSGVRRGPYRRKKKPRFGGLSNCKPVSVPLRATAIPLGRALLPGSSNLPGSRTERAAPPPLFGLAPHGVYPAGSDYSGRGALLPHLFTLTYGAISRARTIGGIFSVALSVKSALSESPRPLAGMLPCGDRTFLPANELEPACRAAIRLTGPTQYCNRGAYFVLNGFQELREARR
jgi:hypothetical protein